MPSSPQYLWVLAPSGCGKTTAVTRCVAEANHPLRDRLGISGRRMRLVDESRAGEKYGPKMLTWLAKNHPPNTADVVLIDGQWPDVEETDTIRKWRNAHSDAVHRIVWLNVRPEEAARRIREDRGRRPNAKSWEKIYTTQQAAGHHRKMAGLVERLKQHGVEIQVVDASSYDYSPSDWNAVRRHCSP